MAVGFSTDVTFDVVPDQDGYLPYPVPDENNMFVWTASLILDDESMYFALLAYKSRVTIVPAIGGGGLIVVEAGAGRRTLTIPLANGASNTYYAVLTSISGMARMLGDDHVRVDVEFAVATSVDA